MIPSTPSKTTSLTMHDPTVEKFLAQKDKAQTQHTRNIRCLFCLIGTFLFGVGLHLFTQELGSIKYVVVFDAGSTGSRVHISHFKVSRSSPQPQLLGNEFHQVKPGLSSYATSPADAAASLDDLLKLAVEAVPPARRSSTPCILRATAGLRQLEGSQSDDILAAVLELLQASPFRVDSESVSILDGQDEGAFAWLTLNYLKGNLGKEPRATATTIDLGGGSVQVAYAVDKDSVDEAYADYFKQVQGGGVNYNVYVHSYLGFGLMAARAAILRSNSDANMCLPQGFAAQYSYSESKYVAQAATGGASGGGCRSLVTEVLEPKAACGAPNNECSFHGAWAGPGLSSDRDLYLFSYFWDRALAYGMAEKGAIDGVISLDEYTAASNHLCTMGLDELRATYPGLGDDQVPYLCMDFSYFSSLLYEGFGLVEDVKANIVTQIKFKGDSYEIAWALGAAIDNLST